MTISINIRAGQAVNGGALGIMTAAANPWEVPDALAHDVVNRGLATYFTSPPNPIGSLSQSEILAVQTVVSPGGNVAAAALSSTSGFPGQIVRLSDGADAGALLVWAIPAGASAYTWCWWHWPQSAY